MATDSRQELATQAEKAYHAKQYGEAAELFERAAQEYAKGGDALKSAELSNNRSVALLQAGDAQGALEAAQGTDAVFAHGGDFRRQAMALSNQAAALEGLNRLKEALDLYLKSNDLLKQIGDEEYRPMVLKSISTLQLRTGHQLEALASMDAALGKQKKLSRKERFLKKLLHIPIDMMKRG